MVSPQPAPAPGLPMVPRHDRGPEPGVVHHLARDEPVTRVRRVILGMGLITLALPGILAEHLYWWAGLLLGVLAGVLARLVFRD